MGNQNPYSSSVAVKQLPDAECSNHPIVITVQTDLQMFGERTDIIVVEGTSVRGTSLLDCPNPDANYYHNMSPKESL